MRMLELTNVVVEGRVGLAAQLGGTNEPRVPLPFSIRPVLVCESRIPQCLPSLLASFQFPCCCTPPVQNMEVFPCLNLDPQPIEQIGDNEVPQPNHRVQGNLQRKPEIGIDLEMETLRATTQVRLGSDHPRRGPNATVQCDLFQKQPSTREAVSPHWIAQTTMSQKSQKTRCEYYCFRPCHFLHFRGPVAECVRSSSVQNPEMRMKKNI
jgi:hypothetical protein